MKRKLGVPIPLEMDVPIFLKDVHWVPKFIMGWKRAFNHFLRVFGHFLKVPKIIYKP